MRRNHYELGIWNAHNLATIPDRFAESAFLRVFLMIAVRMATI